MGIGGGQFHAMKTLERILWIVVGVAVVLKLLRLPPAGLLLVVGLSALATFHMFLMRKLDAHTLLLTESFTVELIDHEN